LDATFPPLTDAHLDLGFWWFADNPFRAVAFAGMVPFEPFPGVGYLKRAYVSPEARGHGLQQQFLRIREAKARSLGWTCLVSECAWDNAYSAANFVRAGFESCEPEQRWGAPDSLYWRKQLAGV